MKNLKRILESQRDELKQLDIASLCPRKEEQELQLDSNLAQVVIGVRRSGKSTLCQKVLLEKGINFAYVNFDDERIRKAKPDDLDDVLQMLYEIYGNFTHLFLDEVQNVKDWPLFVNRLLRQKIRLIITGSNANLLSSELATHLTGRYHKIELFPFSFAEVCHIKNVDMKSGSVKAIGLRQHVLSQYIMEGGFPELITLPITNRHDYLQSLLKAIIEKDICKRYKIKYKKTLSELANKMLDWFCQEKSYNDVTDELGIKSVHTTKNYIEYLQNAYLLYILPKFSFKSKEKSMARKSYAIDPAFIDEHDDSLLTESYGLRLENVIALEVARRVHSEYQQVYYLRKENEFEVDFVIIERSHVEELIQVTYDFSNPSEKLFKREVEGLTRGSALTHCDKLTLIVMYGESGTIEHNCKKVHIVNAADWLLGKQ
ncbi:MAG: ATP-binding protein [Paludibacteraceae bacterium]|nr:ATP-binding protein [Paludibacteraceae bacterium]